MFRNVKTTWVPALTEKFLVSNNAKLPLTDISKRTVSEAGASVGAMVGVAGGVVAVGAAMVGTGVLVARGLGTGVAVATPPQAATTNINVARRPITSAVARITAPL